MSTDSSNNTPSSTPNRQLAQRFIATVQTMLIGLILYILPQITTSFLLVLGIVLSGMTQAQAAEWVDTSLVRLIYSGINDIVLIALLVFFMRLLRETWKSIAVKMPKVKDIGYVFAGFLVYIAIYMVIAVIIYQFSPDLFKQQQEIGFDTKSTGGERLYAFIGLVVLPPIVEEILFRGFLYTRLKRIFSVKTAAVVVSLLFAIAHLQIGFGNGLLWIAALDTFILSLVLVWLREKTGNIWSGTGVHALKNLVAFLILFNVVQ